MSIFDRFRGAGRHRVAGPSEDGHREPDAHGDDEGLDSDSGDRATSGSREAGPWDVTEVEDRGDRLDLGALWVRGRPGMELQLQVEEQSRQVHAVTAVLGESTLQVQAFAAPRSSGLWDEVRAEIVTAVEGQGGTAEEVQGPVGTALRTRMPSGGPDGRTVFAPATFVGVDGPRWFVRGVLSGRAAIDPEAAVPLLEMLRDIVVVRGGDPMAPRELLPLTLPDDAAPEDAAAARPPEPADRATADPFERGPEITEVR